jgi:hypothetical protein
VLLVIVISQSFVGQPTMGESTLRPHTPVYGKMIPWEKVKDIIPRKATFQVIDLETGMSFSVQRRAGSKHADVQPLTNKDTKIMKEIYQGQWSWNRRAIVVKVKHHLIAGSMHGMPHGSGALKNGFPGHFCMHFHQSTTHRSNHVDPAHQIMVYKAAGRLVEYIEKANPHELIDLFLTALNQKDNYLLHLALLQNHDDASVDPTVAQLKKVSAIRRLSTFVEDDLSTLIEMEVPVDIREYRVGLGINKKRLTFVIQRNSLMEPWQIVQVTG